MAEEMLRITKSSNFTLQGAKLEIDGDESLNDYLVELLGYYTVLDEQITLSEIIHALYNMRKFVNNYFSEDYEVSRAFATATKLDSPISKIRLYKSFRIESDEFMDEDEFVYILPEVEFVEAGNGEVGYTKLGDVPIFIDDQLIYNGEEFSFNKKVKFTLLDILTCIFEEALEQVKSGKNIKA